VGGNTGGTFVFLTIVGSFFSFMLLLALLAAHVRSSRSVQGDEWPNVSDIQATFLEVLLMLVWGVIIFAALMACAIAVLTLAVASISFTFASKLTLSGTLPHLLTIQLIYGIVIGASLVVGLALLIPLLISELHERQSGFRPQRPRRRLYEPAARQAVEEPAHPLERDECEALIERRAAGRSIT
jgi:hypothetical protein